MKQTLFPIELYVVIRWWQSLPQDVAVDKNSAMCTKGIGKLRLMRISRDIIAKSNKRIWKEYKPTSFRAHTNCTQPVRVCGAPAWQQAHSSWCLQPVAGALLSLWLCSTLSPPGPSQPSCDGLTCSVCPGASPAQGTLLGVSTQPRGHSPQHISSRDVHSQLR